MAEDGQVLLAPSTACGLWKGIKMRRFDSDISVAIEDLGCRSVDYRDFQPVRVAKCGGIGEFGLSRTCFGICAKRRIIALIERNRSNDFA